MATISQAVKIDRLEDLQQAWIEWCRDTYQCRVNDTQPQRFGQYIVNRFGVRIGVSCPELFYEKDDKKAYELLCLHLFNKDISKH